ncbi:MAG: hypothetical protein AB7V13_05795 [Pseudorhodoplanes sp.]|uniref:hypothetical protein n=1 Tax=Pseudorhodoplanes sp. TaxID=1934341 RepID=UPI003D0C7229
MTRPITDKAEVALEYPDKLYMGSFERSSQFEARLDQTGISLTLLRPGPEDVRKSVHMHLNFGLFADVLRELATSASRLPDDDILHRELVAHAARDLAAALLSKPTKTKR